MRRRILLLAAITLIVLGVPLLLSQVRWPQARAFEIPVTFAPEAAGLVTAPVESPFTLVGLSWQGDAPEAAWFRTRDTTGWSEWFELELADGEGPDPGSDEYAGHQQTSAPVWTGPQEAVQFRIEGSNPIAATASLVDTTDRTKPFLQRALEWMTPSVPAADAAPLQPSIHSRTEWDPTNSCPPREGPYTVQVTMAVIHHTATTNNYAAASVPDILLGICYYHRNTRGWWDIAYNFVVDQYGGIWEARAGGIEAGVQGAHAKGFSSYSTGIALLGSHSTTTPPAATQNALVDLLAWKFSIHNVDPLGTTTVVSKGNETFPAGTEVTLPAIIGHRDVQATACPGDVGYAQLDSYRSRVAGIWRAIPLDTYVSPLVGDFDGDGMEEGAVFRPSDGTWWVTDGAAASVWADLENGQDWSHPLAGDFDGDGRDDIAGLNDGRWLIGRSSGTAFAVTDWSGAIEYVATEARVGDFDGDGRADIAIFDPATGSWIVERSYGTGLDEQAWANWEPGSAWNDHLVGDFDGNGRDDIASFRRPQAEFYVSRSTGSGWSTGLWGALPHSTGWSIHLAADFDGNGRDDIASFHEPTSTWVLLDSSGTALRIAASGRATSMDHWSLAFAGDLDADGRAEILALDAYDGSWERGVPEGNVFAFGTLEDSPYRTSVARSGTDPVAGYRTFFGQEFAWLLTQPSIETTPAPDRIAGVDRYDTAAALAVALYPAGAPTVYVASGEDYADSLAGAPAAARAEAPLLLVRRDAVPPATAAALQHLQPDRIVVLGGTAAVAGNVAAALATTASVERIAGADRFETSAAISAAAFPEGANVAYVAVGTDYPDGAASAAAAAAEEAPLLLVPNQTLPQSIAAELLRLDPVRVVIVGGTGAIADTVANAIEHLLGFAPMRRAGSDRYATAAAVAAGSFPAGTPTVYVATGTDFPDAIVASAAAGLSGAPLLIVPAGELPPIIRDELSRLDPDTIIIIGGPGAVSTGLAQQLTRFHLIVATDVSASLPRP